jgi:hypothetical protein
MGDALRPDSSWAAMTFEGARVNTLVAGARLSLAEKVAWLEEAHRVADHLREQALRRGQPSTSSRKP